MRRLEPQFVRAGALIFVSFTLRNLPPRDPKI
jgi:hypothetical protein